MKPKVLSIIAAALLLAGCATAMDWHGPLTPEVAAKVAINHFGLPEAKDILPGLHHIVKQGKFNTPSTVVVFYKHERPKDYDSNPEKYKNWMELTVLYAGGEPNVWSRVVEIATGGLLNVASSGLHGISFSAARTIVSQAIGDVKGSTATGGDAAATAAGGAATASPTATTGAVTASPTATTGAITNAPKACGASGTGSSVTGC